MIARLWNVREDRTLEVERGMFKILAGYAPNTRSGVSFSSIEATLKEFNKTEEDGSKMATSESEKTRILQTALDKIINDKQIKLTDKNGNVLTSVNLSKSNEGGYNDEDAQTNREKFLKELKESDYPGTCLPGGTRC